MIIFFGDINMEVEEFGTDIHSSWSFYEGDLKLTSNTDNIVQAVENRLSTNLDELDLYYVEYGSLLHNYLGEKRNEQTLEFINIEIENRLLLEPRLSDVEVETYFKENGGVGVNITGVSDEEELVMNLIISDNGEVSVDGG